MTTSPTPRPMTEKSTKSKKSKKSKSKSQSKSYAEVVKDPAPPHTEPAALNWDTMLFHHEDPPGDESWTDVSSVSSCSWPESVINVSTDTDLRAVSPQSQTGTPQSAVQNTNAHNQSPAEHWPDEDLDTRVEHAVAGQIKHRARPKKAGRSRK